MSSIVEASEYGGTDADIFKHRDIADNMLAFWGGVENSPVEPTLKSFIFVGKYLERLDLYTRFGYSVEELKAPLAKLGSYILPLNGLPVPQASPKDCAGWSASCRSGDMRSLRKNWGCC